MTHDYKTALEYLNNKFIGEARLWLKNKDREAFGEAALLGGFSFDGRKYETPKEIQTLLAALQLAQEAEQMRKRLSELETLLAQANKTIQWYERTEAKED